jgi:hypothetical protein
MAQLKCMPCWFETYKSYNIAYCGTSVEALRLTTVLYSHHIVICIKILMS